MNVRLLLFYTKLLNGILSLTCVDTEWDYYWLLETGQVISIMRSHRDDKKNSSKKSRICSNNLTDI